METRIILDNPRKETHLESIIKKCILVGFWSVCALTNARAEDFIIFSHGARAAGMANAVVARAPDPSTVWHNPAGITQLEGFQIYAGGTLLQTGERKYYSIYRDRTLVADSLSRVLPEFYLSCPITKRLRLGLGVNSPILYNIEWPQTSEVEHLVYTLRKMEIRSIAVTPVLAIKLGDNLSLGAGLNLNFSHFQGRYHYPYDSDVMVAMLTNGQVMDAPDALFDLRDFKTHGISYFAGLQWRFLPGFSFGATYRSGLPLTFDAGNVTGLQPETPNAYANAVLAELFPDSPVQSAVIAFSLVDQLQAGLAYRMGNLLEIEFDVSWIFWSQMDTLNIDYSRETFFGSVWSGYSDIEATLHFQDAMNWQLGGEVILTPAIGLRFGAFGKGSPVQSPYLSPAFPLAANRGFSLGLGYQTNHLMIDMAYVFTSVSEISDSNGALIRWGDPSQKYLSRRDQCFMIHAGVKF